jgi:hypothetical protein
MTEKEQKLKNAKIRMALREGKLPYIFVDKDEKRYRQIIYDMSKELGCKLIVKKSGAVWRVTTA